MWKVFFFVSVLLRENSVLTSTYSPARGISFLANKCFNVYSVPAPGGSVEEAVRGELRWTPVCLPCAWACVGALRAPRPLCVPSHGPGTHKGQECSWKVTAWVLLLSARGTQATGIYRVLAQKLGSELTSITRKLIFFFFIDVYLTYNILLVAGLKRNDSLLIYIVKWSLQ